MGDLFTVRTPVLVVRTWFVVQYLLLLFRCQNLENCMTLFQHLQFTRFVFFHHRSAFLLAFCKNAPTAISNRIDVKNLL
ncbi:Uncharacterised protein [Kingella kingae]|nr:Uncharacterised protein [Kingella kingae]